MTTCLRATALHAHCLGPACDVLLLALQRPAPICRPVALPLTLPLTIITTPSAPDLAPDHHHHPFCP
jgi:hypothetical protein